MAKIDNLIGKLLCAIGLHKMVVIREERPEGTYWVRIDSKCTRINCEAEEEKYEL